MINLDTLKSWRSPIGEVLRQVVRGCLSRCTMCHHHSPPFAACESKRIGSDKPNESCLSTEDANAIVGCSSGFHAGKRVRGSGSPSLLANQLVLSLCHNTTYCQTGLAYTWYLEPKHVTWNHNSEPTKSIR